MDGTFYLGDRLVEGALHFMEVLQRQGRRFLFLTNNSSKNRVQYAKKITDLGFPVAEEQIFTSGEATALFLQKIKPGARLYVVGTQALEEEFRKHGFELVQENPEYVVLGFDTGFTYQKLWKLCDHVRQGVPYIATHADLNCPVENGQMPDAGAVMAFVRASTGREPDTVIGKPNRWILEAAVEKMNLPVEALGMVGDRLYTDIALGQTCGIATVLVLSGETKLEDVEQSPYQPDAIFDTIGGLAEWLEEHDAPWYDPD